MILSTSQLLLAVLPVALAAPAPAPIAVAAPHPMITARASLSDIEPLRVQERNIISSAVSSIKGLSSYLSSIQSAAPLQNFPTGSAVESSLGISDSDLAASPTKALNMPGYANWTEQGWNLRVHGNIYKQPNISESKLNDLANAYVVGTPVTALPPAAQTQARNLTAEIYVVQQGNVNVSFHIEPGTSNGGDGQANGGSAITAPGGAQNLTLVGQTTVEGDFDQFIPLANVSGSSGGYMLPGNDTTQIQRMNVYVDGTDNGNATSYLVPTAGLTIVSDIDDILRVTQIYEPAAGLNNTFAKPFVPWMNMPDIYANWSRSIPDFHFHYLTTTPEQITLNYMEFIYSTYPGGSFDTRPLNFSDVTATVSIRKYLLEKIFQTYPERKFILIADTSNSDVMRDYPLMATEFPGQVQCIFLRNTTATDPGDQFPYDTSGFQGLNQQMYMFFLVPDDLTNLDIVNGQCYNATIKQNVTFSEQGLPAALTKSAAGRVQLGWSGMTMAVLIVLSAALL